jgi:hypothetical protein
MLILEINYKIIISRRILGFSKGLLKIIFLHGEIFEFS